MERLGRTLLYTYGVADLFFALMINMEAYFFTAFLTDYAQFSLALTGYILTITSVIDIACALAGGVILQRATLKHGGKYRSWFLVGPPIVAPLFVFQFTKVGTEWTAAFIVITAFVTSHLLFNVVVSAGAAMAGRLSQMPDERTILSASRAQGMSIANLIFSATAMPMVLYFAGQTSKVVGFTITVAIYALLMVVGYWYVYHITAGKDPYDEFALSSSKKKSGQPVLEIAGLVLRNPPLLFLMLTQIFTSSSLFVIAALAIYYFTYVAGNPAFLAVFLLANSIGRIVGSFAAPSIGIRLGKRNCYWICLLIGAAGFASGRLFNEWPWAFTLVFCVSTMMVSVAASMSTALFADTVVYGEWKTGTNIRAFTMALMNLPIKIGILIRSAVVTLGLMAIGFAANTTPTPRVIHGISAIMTLIPGVAYAIAAAIFFFGYRMEETQVVKMQQEIAARRVPEPTPAGN